jgi:hypothetical protein
MHDGFLPIASWGSKAYKAGLMVEQQHEVPRVQFRVASLMSKIKGANVAWRFCRSTIGTGAVTTRPSYTDCTLSIATNGRTTAAPSSSVCGARRGILLRQDKHGKASEKLPDTHNIV